MSIFGRKWMDEGKVGRYLRDRKDSDGNPTPGDKAFVKAAFNTFQKSEEWKIMRLALEDYRDYVDTKLVASGQSSIRNQPGYPYYLAQLANELRFPDWVISLVEDLKGFEESEKESVKHSPIENVYT